MHIDIGIEIDRVGQGLFQFLLRRCPIPLCQRHQPQANLGAVAVTAVEILVAQKIGDAAKAAFGFGQVVLLQGGKGAGDARPHAGHFGRALDGAVDRHTLVIQRMAGRVIPLHTRHNRQLMIGHAGNRRLTRAAGQIDHPLEIRFGIRQLALDAQNPAIEKERQGGVNRRQTL